MPKSPVFDTARGLNLLSHLITRLIIASSTPHFVADWVIIESTDKTALGAVLGLWRGVMGASAYAGEINRNRKAKADRIVVLISLF